MKSSSLNKGLGEFILRKCCTRGQKTQVKSQVKMGRSREGILDLRICMAVALLAVLLNTQNAVDAYKIGVGRADCTGPSVEVIFVSIY